MKINTSNTRLALCTTAINAAYDYRDTLSDYYDCEWATIQQALS